MVAHTEATLTQLENDVWMADTVLQTIRGKREASTPAPVQMTNEGRPISNRTKRFLGLAANLVLGFKSMWNLSSLVPSNATATPNSTVKLEAPVVGSIEKHPRIEPILDQANVTSGRRPWGWDQIPSAYFQMQHWLNRPMFDDLWLLGPVNHTVSPRTHEPELNDTIQELAEDVDYQDYYYNEQIDPPKTDYSLDIYLSVLAFGTILITIACFLGLVKYYRDRTPTSAPPPVFWVTNPSHETLSSWTLDSHLDDADPSASN